MSPKKKQPGFNLLPAPVLNVLRFVVGPGRTMSLAVVILAMFAGAWYWGWQRVQQDVLESPAYWLTADDIIVVNEASWIRADLLREEVFNDPSLDRRLSIMDADLNERIARAFALNPWVAKVRRVSKQHPAQVMVELEYRRPVCIVEKLHWLIPVDVHGNVLPWGDFALNEARRYPRVVQIDSTPQGPVGTCWGDVRVVGAAEIAAVVGPHWEKFSLNRIVPVRNSATRHGECSYELYTHSGTRIIWGAAPGLKRPGEGTAEEKLAVLEMAFQKNNTLEGPTGAQEIDLPYELGKKQALAEYHPPQVP